ncbi:hypothetical protein NliqN6_5775 [Naganishia liquefaciens]|uniref:Uncharacterized protein n=1 Tax=Naganishia liquefaciens TaxID=104408 RepID=A0A8H3TYW7_9TREE|nr:hypothetical protein NliqN6_5775 [Naganishia liquefaciens]
MSASRGGSSLDPSAAINENAPTFGLQERQPTDEEKALIDDVLQLYQLNPVSSAYAHYDKSAVFSDPIGIAEGLEKLKSQFNAMPSIFSKSYTRAVRVLDNPEVKPPSLQISLTQEYHFKGVGSQKTVDSKITFHRDPATNLILRHEEEWAGNKNAMSQDGFWGSLQEARKKFQANLVHAVTDSTPKDQK